LVHFFIAYNGAQVTVGEDAVVNALAEMEVLFQREADGSLLNLTEAGPLLLLDDGFGGEIIYFRFSVPDS
jgi:hypothetical protein